jgi:hypothetical protein
MLKPYVCVACEKVITDQPSEGEPASQGVPSLIGLFNKIILHVPADSSEIPQNAVAPKEWAIYSAWDNEPGDEKKEYFLCIQILYPDQSPFGQVTRMRVNVQPKHRSQMTARVQGFPLGQPGFYTVRTWLEENNQIVGGQIEFKIELEVRKQSFPPKME